MTQTTTTAAALYAILDGDQIGVVDPNGGIWWPSDEAQAEIGATADPEGEAILMCESSPMRGEWSC